MARVFITRSVAPSAVARLSQRHEVRVWPEAGPPPRQALEEAVRECEGLLCLLTERVDGELLARAPKLRVVSNMAVGVDNVDVAACTARKIPVGHTPGVLTQATADLSFALLLASARRLVEGDAFVRAGRWSTWDPSLLLGRELNGAALGIAGFGAIGQAVAARARGFGMRVLYFSRHPVPFDGATRVDQRELLSRSDFLSLHLPLTAATRHWLSTDELSQMKPGSVLINTARGAIVDQRALLAALEAGRPAFAALDVLDPEPPAPDEPLLRSSRVLLLPHLGSATLETRTRMAELAADNLLAGLDGQRLLHLVNPEVYA